jgi:23S rRNA (uracil1939-C5)-methyltransferase
VGLSMSHGKANAPQVGQELEVTIESVAFGGDGVARHSGYVLFVPDVIPGERVRVRIIASKRSYGRAVPVRIMEASPDRVIPRCPVYGICGGCQYQHVSYQRSLEFKQSQLNEVALRIGGLSIEDVCDPIRPAPEPYNYRNVVSLRVMKEESRWKVGYFARDNRTLVPISHCPIASQAINGKITGIESVLERFPHSDRVRDIILKSADGEVVTYPNYRGAYRLVGDDRLSYQLHGLAFQYGPTTFFQVNHSMIPVLVDLVGEGLDPATDETLFDLYAGVGLFAVGLADRYRRVIGVETAGQAVAHFEENIRLNGVRNVTAVRGSVETKLQGARREMDGKTVSILVDPPREGLKDDVIGFLNQAPVRRLVYVSCDPSTLARDLKKLLASFGLRKITPLDMFPQTGHIETVTVLERR